MAIIKGSREFIGKTNASQISSGTDDGQMSSNNFGFPFKYAGVSLSYVMFSGNSFVTLSSSGSTEHLKVNRRDGICKGLYQETTDEYTRIAWYGFSHYSTSSQTEANRLEWEIYFYKDSSNTMELVVGRTPKTSDATNGFLTQGGIDYTGTFEQGQSYVFQGDDNGKNYKVHVGCRYENTSYVEQDIVVVDPETGKEKVVYPTGIASNVLVEQEDGDFKKLSEVLLECGGGESFDFLQTGRLKPTFGFENLGTFGNISSGNIASRLSFYDEEQDCVYSLIPTNTPVYYKLDYKTMTATVVKTWSSTEYANAFGSTTNTFNQPNYVSGCRIGNEYCYFGWYNSKLYYFKINIKTGAIIEYKNASLSSSYSLMLKNASYLSSSRTFVIPINYLGGTSSSRVGCVKYSLSTNSASWDYAYIQTSSSSYSTVSAFDYNSYNMNSYWPVSCTSTTAEYVALVCYSGILKKCHFRHDGSRFYQYKIEDVVAIGGSGIAMNGNTMSTYYDIEKSDVYVYSGSRGTSYPMSFHLCSQQIGDDGTVTYDIVDLTDVITYAHITDSTPFQTPTGLLLICGREYMSSSGYNTRRVMVKFLNREKEGVPEFDDVEETGLPKVNQFLSCETEHRPYVKDQGFQIYDKDLNQPLWWDGQDWVGSGGTFLDHKVVNRLDDSKTTIEDLDISMSGVSWGNMQYTPKDALFYHKKSGAIRVVADTGYYEIDQDNAVVNGITQYSSSEKDLLGYSYNAQNKTKIIETNGKVFIVTRVYQGLSVIRMDGDSGRFELASTVSKTTGYFPSEFISSTYSFSVGEIVTAFPSKDGERITIVFCQRDYSTPTQVLVWTVYDTVKQSFTPLKKIHESNLSSSPVLLSLQRVSGCGGVIDQKTSPNEDTAILVVGLYSTCLSSGSVPEYFSSIKVKFTEESAYVISEPKNVFPYFYKNTEDRRIMMNSETTYFDSDQRILYILKGRRLSNAVSGTVLTLDEMFCKVYVEDENPMETFVDLTDKLPGIHLDMASMIQHPDDGFLIVGGTKWETVGTNNTPNGDSTVSTYVYHNITAEERSRLINPFISCTENKRPTVSDVGFQIYDETTKSPLWWNGKEWSGVGVSTGGGSNLDLMDVYESKVIHNEPYTFISSISDDIPHYLVLGEWYDSETHCLYFVNRYFTTSTSSQYIAYYKYDITARKSSEIKKYNYGTDGYQTLLSTRSHQHRISCDSPTTLYVIGSSGLVGINKKTGDIEKTFAFTCAAGYTLYFRGMMFDEKRNKIHIISNHSYYEGGNMTANADYDATPLYCLSCDLDTGFAEPARVDSRPCSSGVRRVLVRTYMDKDGNPRLAFLGRHLLYPDYISLYEVTIKDGDPTKAFVDTTYTNSVNRLIKKDDIHTFDRVYYDFKHDDLYVFKIESSSPSPHDFYKIDCSSPFRTITDLTSVISKDISTYLIDLNTITLNDGFMAYGWYGDWNSKLPSKSAFIYNGNDTEFVGKGDKVDDSKFKVNPFVSVDSTNEVFVNDTGFSLYNKTTKKPMWWNGESWTTWKDVNILPVGGAEVSSADYIRYIGDANEHGGFFDALSKYDPYTGRTFIARLKTYHSSGDVRPALFEYKNKKIIKIADFDLTNKEIQALINMVGVVSIRMCVTPTSIVFAHGLSTKVNGFSSVSFIEIDKSTGKHIETILYDAPRDSVLHVDGVFYNKYNNCVLAAHCGLDQGLMILGYNLSTKASVPHISYCNTSPAGSYGDPFLNSTTCGELSVHYDDANKKVVIRSYRRSTAYSFCHYSCEVKVDEFNNTSDVLASYAQVSGIDATYDTTMLMVGGYSTSFYDKVTGYHYFCTGRDSITQDENTLKNLRSSLGRIKYFNDGTFIYEDVSHLLLSPYTYQTSLCETKNGFLMIGGLICDDTTRVSHSKIYEFIRKTDNTSKSSSFEYNVNPFVVCDSSALPEVSNQGFQVYNSDIKKPMWWNGSDWETLSIDTSEIDNLKSSVEDLSADVDDLKQSVSSGKQMLASAITDKGVQTSSSDSFRAMATNVLKIQSGGGDGGATSAFNVYYGGSSPIVALDGDLWFPDFEEEDVSTIIFSSKEIESYQDGNFDKYIIGRVSNLEVERHPMVELMNGMLTCRLFNFTYIDKTNRYVTTGYVYNNGWVKIYNPEPFEGATIKFNPMYNYKPIRLVPTVKGISKSQIMLSEKSFEASATVRAPRIDLKLTKGDVIIDK